VLIMGSLTGTTRTFSRDQVVHALDRLQADGRWPPEHAAALLDELDRFTATAPGAGSGRRTPVPLTNRFAEAAGYAGAVLAGSAGAVLVAQQWDDLGRLGRVAILAGVTVVLAAVGIAVATVAPGGGTTLRQPAGAVRRRLASTALTIAAATAAGAVGVLAGNRALLFAAATAVLVIAGAQSLAPSAVSETAGLAAVVLLAGAILDEAAASTAVLTVGLAALGLAWAALAWTPLLTLPALGLALGLGLVLTSGGLGAFTDTQPARAVGIAVLGLLAAGGLAGYVRSGRAPFAATAVLSLALLVLRLAADSLGAPVALLLTGLVLLGSGALLVTRKRNALNG